MNRGKLWMLALLASMAVACSDDDSGEDEDRLDMSKVTNKDLYYNKWQNTRDSYVGNDLVDVYRFDNNGKVWSIDFGGKTEELVGSWSDRENSITITDEDGNTEVWNVLKCNNDELEVMVNDGSRLYENSPSYLQDITGDAYLLTEIENNTKSTCLRVNVEGKNAVNIKSAAVILSNAQVVDLKYEGSTHSWVEKNEISSASINLPRKVIFYVKSGEHEFKFADHVYSDGLSNVNFSTVSLDAINVNNILQVSWNLLSDAAKNIYYQVEILDENLDPYFVSPYLQNPVIPYKIDRFTQAKDDINKMDKLNTSGQRFYVRLSAVLLEPGVEYTSKYSAVNLQAVTRIKRLSVWN